MSVLEHLEPQPVFQFFEKICSIPHGSGNTAAIAAYLKDFAESRGYHAVLDAAGNVIVTLPATPGREDRDPLILQGHMDMVAVRTADSAVDPATDPLKLGIDGDKIYAEGTSLGADNGIAVAYMCALMDDPSIPHPELTLIITTEEETGMDGARAVDPALLTAGRFINMDSEDEGIFLAGCAGGGRVRMELPLPVRRMSGCRVTAEVSGLLGGHSGQEIHRGRGNANLIAGRLLQALTDAGFTPGVAALDGGVADNAIPASSTLTLVFPAEQAADTARIGKCLADTAEIIRSELGARDPGFAVTVTEDAVTDCLCIAGDAVPRAAALLMILPDGVEKMSTELENLPETSLNTGIMHLVFNGEEGRLVLDIAVRSCLDTARDHLVRRLELLAEACGAAHSVHSLYPGWRYDPDSVICAHFRDIWQRMTGKTPRVEAIHAGVECGIFKEKKPELDCVSFGPQMEGIHSPAERLYISSVARNWEFLKEALAAWDVKR